MAVPYSTCGQNKQTKTVQTAVLSYTAVLHERSNLPIAFCTQTYAAQGSAAQEKLLVFGIVLNVENAIFCSKP